MPKVRLRVQIAGEVSEEEVTLRGSGGVMAAAQAYVAQQNEGQPAKKRAVLLAVIPVQNLPRPEPPPRRR